MLKKRHYSFGRSTGACLVFFSNSSTSFNFHWSLNTCHVPRQKVVAGITRSHSFFLSLCSTVLWSLLLVEYHCDLPACLNCGAAEVSLIYVFEELGHSRTPPEVYMRSYSLQPQWKLLCILQVRNLKKAADCEKTVALAIIGSSIFPLCPGHNLIREVYNTHVGWRCLKQRYRPKRRFCKTK